MHRHSHNAWKRTSVLSVLGFTHPRKMQDPVGLGQDGQIDFIQDGMQMYGVSSADFVERPKYKGFGKDMRCDGYVAARHLVVTNILSLWIQGINGRICLHKMCWLGP